MSFGLLKHFKDLKKGSQETVQTAFAKHVVIGQDLGAVLKLVELVKTNESVKLVSPRVINKKLLLENYQYGVSQLRSEAAVTAIYRKFHSARILPIKAHAQFYKDGKFHDFGGRAKSMELKSGEDFFIQRGYRFDIASFFSTEDWEQLDDLLGRHLDLRITEGIEKTTPGDLVEKAEWTLSFKDYQKLACENLYVSYSPKKFLGFLKDKDRLTSELIDFGTSAKNIAGLSLTWMLDKELSQEERTIFIPQSMTHEWGHFVLEFEAFNHATRTQSCHGLFLIHEEEPQTEDLASKIKLMKRVIDRVFPNFENHIKAEFIRFDEEMFVSDIKDSALEQVGFDYPTLKFIGQTSPMSADHVQEKFLARVLLNSL